MHKLEIIVTPSAEEDMQNIFDFIAQDNISKAIEMIDIFEKKLIHWLCSLKAGL